MPDIALLKLIKHAKTMLRVISTLSAAFSLLAFGLTMSGAIKQSKVERHYGWRAKSEKVSQEEEHRPVHAFLQRLKSAVQDTREAESAPPKSNLQRLLDRRRRDTAPFDLGR